MNPIRIAILFGGCSTEYEISLQSAHSVIQSLNPAVYNVYLLGITREGKWLRYGGPVENLLDNTWMEHSSCVPAILSPDRLTHGILECHGNRLLSVWIDVAFPVLHGKNGEDGTVQGLLALSGIPCVGCGVLSSALCMDKDLSHRLASHAGVKIPPAVVLTRPYASALPEKIACLRYPLFVKPARAGSSIGISKVLKPAELQTAVNTAFTYDSKVLIEQEIDGFEVGCAVLGNEALILGEIDEIELLGGYFDYEEKYTLKTAKIHMPARIDANTAQRVKSTGIAVYRALMCSGFARVDLFITKEGDIVFNEVNTIPGFTSHSRFPSMLMENGLSLRDIVDTSIKLAFER